MNIFCISGLGADERIFSRLNFHQHRVRHIPWIIPDRKESLNDYVNAMASQIDTDDPVLIGVSFGGMIAIEIAKTRNVKKVVLISSIKTKFEKPFYYKVASTLRLNKFIPLRPYRILEPIENYSLGVTTPEEKVLAAEYRKHLNITYSNWAIDQVLHWHNTAVPPNLVHIHGSNDHVFPLRYVKPDYIIEGGSHLMVLNRADEISPILQKILVE